ncbi:MAG: MFS transporter [Thermoleophilaceae bacterium]|nr:MFS transporter [Thermoleophilaceae bacterium]
MTMLDNLVVITALPVIKRELGGGIETLEWTVNGYTLTFAVLLLTGAALGDRFGRRRMLALGLGVFTLGSAAAALAPSIELLIASRAVQGIGGAIVTPLTLTILTDAVPAEKRGLALGAWGGVAGLAIALGPLVGGAVTEGIAWQWIFWLNVPLGALALPLVRTRLAESYGPDGRLDLPGLALASAALLGIVWALVRGNGAGWTSPEVIGAAVVGVAALAAFVAWELRAPAPMLPMRFFGSRAFAAANAASLAMYAGMFGSVFLLTQFLQLVMGYSPLEAGVRTLPWTAMPLVVNPAAGALSDRIGGRPIMAFGLILDAIAFGWMAAIVAPDTPYAQLVPGLVLAGIGTAAFFAPVANVVMAAVRPEESGQASGATNAIREIGGVLGVAVLAAVFASRGDYGTPTSFVAGFTPALTIGAAIVAVGGGVALLIPRRRAAVSLEAAAQAA